jgi:hypothetical protein
MHRVVLCLDARRSHPREPSAAPHECVSDGAPAELDWTDKQRQTRALAEYPAALDEAADPDPNRKPEKVMSPSDPSSVWTA